MTCTELRRLQELKRYAILDTEPEETFDRITRLTRDLFDTPIALISLVDENRQWFKSKQGLQLDETTREGSFCASALESGYPLVVEDTLLDKRFKDAEIVQGPLGIRFYAGVPLTSPSGNQLGVLCIMDDKPRKLSRDQLANLYDMGRVVIDEIELRSLATFDCLTGLQQRQGFWLKARQELERSKRYDSDLSLILFDIDGFKKVNDSFGHAAADRVLQQIADICRSQVRVFDTPARIAGEKFTILLPQTEIGDAFEIAERIRTSIANMPTHYRSQDIFVTTSFGVASINTSKVYSVTELLRVADKCLSQAKSKGRNRTVAVAA
nr:sensor domain-containing diguanylate cyclase [uncultured Cohaesibacter sp.]